MEIMNAEEFNKLTLDEKAELLNGKGMLCQGAVFGKHQNAITIYILSGMIVSVYYSKESKDITCIRAWGRAVERAKLLEYVPSLQQ
jgi:hypothetical protein